MMQILAKDTPLISKKLIAPWRLASLGVGLLLLIMGSFYLPSADWDIPICFVMGIPALCPCTLVFSAGVLFTFEMDAVGSSGVLVVSRWDVLVILGY